jgi:hypothetical protein
MLDALAEEQKFEPRRLMDPPDPEARPFSVEHSSHETDAGLLSPEHPDP